MPATGRSPEMQFIPTRDALLGEGMTIRRALPSAQCRMIGAWCFLDHFGPVDATRGDGLRVGPHPHNSLQTFTWPLAGEILHRDSLGYEQIIRPGQVNLMTAGRGIVHSERTGMEARASGPKLYGIQAWLALPKTHEEIDPQFVHHGAPELPRIVEGRAPEADDEVAIDPATVRRGGYAVGEDVRVSTPLDGIRTYRLVGTGTYGAGATAGSSYLFFTLDEARAIARQIGAGQDLNAFLGPELFRRRLAVADLRGHRQPQEKSALNGLIAGILPRTRSAMAYFC